MSDSIYVESSIGTLMMKWKFVLLFRFFVCLLLSAGVHLHVEAQPRLLGLSPQGGDVFGTIYSTSINGADLRSEYVFDGNPGAFPYFTRLCNGNNGKLYGLTTMGGRYNYGVLFSFDTSTHEYQKLIDFDGQNYGSIPRGSLIVASNGKMYGMCNQGGNYGYGTLFEFDVNNNALVKLHDFDGSGTGRFPFSHLVQATNGHLYGLCYQGGLFNEGTLFQYDILNDTVIKHVDFDGSVKGRNPYGSLVQASNGALYGMSYQGGSMNYGTFFSFEPGTNVFAVKFDFNGTSLGSNPYGTPLQSTNGNLYALTYLRGTNNFGTLIEYDPVLDTCYKHYDYTGSIGGRNPYAELTEWNGQLYSMTPFGGLNNGGVIFSFDLQNNTMSKELDLPGNSNGFNPYGTLTLCGNEFYGCTYQGGTFTSGVIFKYNPGLQQYSKLLDLNSADKGAEPYGGLMKASNGKYYGLTYKGGKYNAGVLFEFNPESNVYTLKAEFDGSISGRNPYGTLCESNDNNLYGFCYQGGSNNFGTIFKYDLLQDTLTLVATLDDYTLGRNPYGSMTLAPDGKLYGMVAFGGTDDFGVILQYDPVSNMVNTVYEFKDSLGAIPFGTLTVFDSTTLYGCTYQGGSNDLGVVFKFNISTLQYNVIHHFDGLNSGSYPQGKLVLDVSDSTLYGVTQSGGLYFDGVLFSYQPSSMSFQKRKDIGAASESESSGNLMINSKGWIVGTTRLGGMDNKGVVYIYEPSKDSLYSNAYFDGQSGQNPSGELIEFCKPGRASIKTSACYQLTSPSGKYIWTQSGFYNDTITASTGCDSIIQIELQILDSSSSFMKMAVCDSFKAADGQIFRTSGQYNVVIDNYLGCDSIIHLELDILNSSYDTSISTCNSFLAPDGRTFTQSGMYELHLLNSKGCDSLIRLNLKILRTRLDTSYRACRKFMAPDGKVYVHSGNYTAQLLNQAGCDSIINFQLELDTLDTRVSVNNEVLNAEASIGTFRWLNCADYNVVAGEVNKTFIAKQNGSYAVEVENNSCKDTSECYTVSNLSLVTSEMNGIRIYPNPVTDNLKISLAGITEEIKIEVINSVGQVIFVNTFTNCSEIAIDIPGPAGVYMLKLMIDGNVGWYTFIKQ